MPRAHVAAAAALALAVACKEPRVPHPSDPVRYICCNLHYEKPEITDANYLRGKLIPLAHGSRSSSVEGRVKFEAADTRRFTLALKYGRAQPHHGPVPRPHLPGRRSVRRLPKLPPDGKQAAEVDERRGG